MKHSSSLTHLKDSQYLWHFLEIHEQPFSEFNNYKNNIEIILGESITDFQSKYDIDVLPYMFTAYCSKHKIFHRFMLYLKKYVDIKNVIQQDMANDIFVFRLLENSEPFEIITILILFQYFFL